jgi:hypothetical protein
MNPKPLEYGRRLLLAGPSMWRIAPAWPDIWFQLRQGDEVVGYYQYLPDMTLQKVPVHGADLAILREEDRIPDFNRICRQTGYDGQGEPVFDCEPLTRTIPDGCIIYTERDNPFPPIKLSHKLARHEELRDVMKIIADKWLHQRECELRPTNQVK